jgi:hypothetical protein
MTVARSLRAIAVLGVAVAGAALAQIKCRRHVVGDGAGRLRPQEHNGLDNRARVMIRIENGQWVLAK